MGADAGETRSVAVGMVFIATSGVLVSIMSTFTWIVTDARISTMQIVCRHRALHQTCNSVLGSIFKPIRAHLAAKLPPTPGPFRTRSNPTLAQP